MQLSEGEGRYSDFLLDVEENKNEKEKSKE